MPTFSPAFSISAFTPLRGDALMRSSPRYTMARFSSFSGTTSATVAIAARSISAMAASLPPSAQTSLNATPVPQM